MIRRHWIPPPRPAATSPDVDPIPMIDVDADRDAFNAQVLAAKRWCYATGIPYFGPEPDPLAECYTCGHRAPWDGSVEELRRARCSKCGGRGACLWFERS